MAAKRLSILAAGVIAALLLAVFPASGHGEHDWMRQERLVNPETGEWCCDDRDCDNPEKITFKGATVVVTLHGVAFDFPLSQVQRSKDGRDWVCINPATQKARCLFLGMAT